MSIADEVIGRYTTKDSLLIFGAVAEDASRLWHRLRFNVEHDIPRPDFRIGLSFVLETAGGRMQVFRGNGDSVYETDGHRFVLSSQGYRNSKSRGGASLEHDGVKYELYRSRGLNFFIYSAESESLIDAFSIDLSMDHSLGIHRNLSLSTLFLFRDFPDEEKVPYVKSLKDGDDYQRRVAYEICDRYHGQYPKLNPLLMKMLWSGIGTVPDKKRALHFHQC
ncbi:MAG: hypothetical protein IKR86_11510 [Candidatus Methanomethylophilaceae archaeon]|nr:hypothetical protein [Candidatus Methanomethylophilaceae archaeon]